MTYKPRPPIIEGKCVKAYDVCMCTAGRDVCLLSPARSIEINVSYLGMHVPF
jgi:hypothetical protein